MGKSKPYHDSHTMGSRGKSLRFRPKTHSEAQSALSIIISKLDRLSVQVRIKRLTYDKCKAEAAIAKEAYELAPTARHFNDYNRALVKFKSAISQLYEAETEHHRALNSYNHMHIQAEKLKLKESQNIPQE